MTRRQPDNQPRENRVVSEPATVEACRRDYQQGAAARAGLDKDAHRRYAPKEK
ncbi:hypothetical protein JJV70_15155 [Streptomyces sp. JJ66]|uniref:hypothetical protein n=1 Tax=Streptomyces sp. JJ66 TaxID=2803843 RepID=UPI001C58EFCD|nr:hypothetical protein [Streptomyces sp. JJ66]MBW1603417.1 hypothetical protein [Streptomyces sp. JJ66]